MRNMFSLIIRQGGKEPASPNTTLERFQSVGYRNDESASHRERSFTSCPKCKRDVTREANLIRVPPALSDMCNFVIVCECGYFSEIIADKEPLAGE